MENKHSNVEIRRVSDDLFAVVRSFELSPQKSTFVRQRILEKTSKKFAELEEEPGKIVSYAVTEENGKFSHRLSTEAKNFDYVLATPVHFPFCTNVLRQDATCPVCGNRFVGSLEKKKHTSKEETCSVDCGKVLKRMMNVWNIGEEHPKKLAETNSKMINTIKERYGVTGTQSVPGAIEKTRKTNIERFGAEHHMQSSSSRELREQLFMEKFGYKHPWSSEEVKERIAMTNLERRGFKYPMMSPEVRDNVKKSFMEKYGYDNISKVPEFKERIQDTQFMNKYGMSREETVTAFITEFDTNGIESACEMFGIGISSGFSWLDEERKDKLKSGRSLAQRIAAQTISSMLGIECIHDKRGLLDNKQLEADIFFRELNAVIEFNGVFWHGKKTFQKDLEKAKLFREKGFRFFAINEFTTKRQMETIAKLLASVEKKLHARKLSLRDISVQEAKEFCEAHHAQGYSGSSVRLGLFDMEELVQVMTFGIPRFAKGYDFELVRYCTKSRHEVTGGSQRLFKNFCKTHCSPGMTVISYCDNAFFGGRVYEKLGFTRRSYGGPGYVWARGKEIVSRYQAQKSKLVEIYGEEVDILTEEEIMESAGYEKVYDLGQSVFEFILE